MRRGSRQALLTGLALGAAAGVATILAPASAPANAAPLAEGASKCRHTEEGPGSLSINRIEKAVECLINKRRQSRGRSKLKEKSAISKAAARHSRHMVNTGCFGHACPGEPDLSGRLHSTSYLPCNCSWSIGENIAFGNQKMGTAAAIAKGWMKSAPHKKNILTRSFEHVGVGVVRGRPGAAGDGSSVTYTMVFGFRKP